MKRRFFYLIFLISTGIALTEVALKIPLVKKFISRPEHFAPEIPSTAGYSLSEARAKDLLAYAASHQPVLQKAENIGMDDSTIKNEPASPLSYMKGRAADLKGEPIRSVKIQNGTGRIIYDVKYSFDSQRRRKTLPENALSASEKNIVLIGCSFVFGMGVNDSETIPSHIKAELGPKYNIYNLGIIAGGANDFLDDVTGGRRITDIEQKKEGLAVYVYFPIHRERTFCLADCYRDEWRRRIYLNNSAWNIAEDFEVKRIGTVLESRSQTENILRQLFYNSEIGLFSQNFYSAGRPYYKREYVKYLKAMAKQWQKRNFKFVVYLLDTPDTPWTDEDISILKESAVDFIYFNRDELFSMLGAGGIIPGDDHFTSAGNKLRAVQIVEGLKNKGYL